MSDIKIGGVPSPHPQDGTNQTEATPSQPTGGDTPPSKPSGPPANSTQPQSSPYASSSGNSGRSSAYTPTFFASGSQGTNQQTGFPGGPYSGGEMSLAEASYANRVNNTFDQARVQHALNQMQQAAQQGGSNLQAVETAARVLQSNPNVGVTVTQNGQSTDFYGAAGAAFVIEHAALNFEGSNRVTHQSGGNAPQQPGGGGVGGASTGQGGAGADSFEGGGTVTVKVNAGDTEWDVAQRALPQIADRAGLPHDEKVDFVKYWTARLQARNEMGLYDRDRALTSEEFSQVKKDGQFTFHVTPGRAGAMYQDLLNRLATYEGPSLEENPFARLGEELSSGSNATLRPSEQYAASQGTNSSAWRAAQLNQAFDAQPRQPPITGVPVEGAPSDIFQYIGQRRGAGDDTTGMTEPEGTAPSTPTTGSTAGRVPETVTTEQQETPVGTPLTVRRQPEPQPQPTTTRQPSPQPEGGGAAEFFGDFAKGVVGGDFVKKDSWGVFIGQTVGGLNPLSDLRDIAAGVKDVVTGEEGGWLTLGANLAGAIPLGGDALKALIKAGRKVARQVGDAAAQQAVKEAGDRLAQQGAESVTEEAITEAVERTAREAAGGAGLAARVEKPGVRPDLREAYKTNADVPAHYRNDPRFDDLAKDPDHAGATKPSTRAEAMAGLEAEAQGLVKGPISRGPKGTEFYDADGRPWDVKAPPSPKLSDRFRFDPEKSGESLMRELREKTDILPDGTRTPPGTFPNGMTGVAEPRRIILDSTYLNEADHTALWEWLSGNLTAEELSRIVEVNIRP